VGLLLAGSGGVLAGTIWGLWFPINKNLWTSSYVLLSAGFACMVLGVCYWAIELRSWTRWALPWFVLGSNAILAFVVTGLFTRCLTLWRVSDAGGTTTLYDWIYTEGFASWAGPLNGSLAFAVAYVVLFILVLWLPYRMGWFLKI
jgi:predicted acyltransferase